MTRLLFTLLQLVLVIPNVFGTDSIRGIVRDQHGRFLSGATIIIKGTGEKFSTDSRGVFEISTISTYPLALQISYIGLRTREIYLTTSPAVMLEVVLSEEVTIETVGITAHRRVEAVQDVPIPLTVIGGAQIEKTGTYNVNRIKELVPTLQLYSSNPRNTTLNIRGLGSTFGLTNDGIDPGVGFYIDGVYYAMPAAATLDFIDIAQIEVLRGPQGTLFGKNTAAGVFNVTTRKPSFVNGVNLELSYGNFGFIQAKASVTGPLAKNFAARVSFSGTQRDGLLYHTVSQKHINDLNNLGIRGQLLYTPSDNTDIILAADHSRQRPEGYAQVLAGIVQTQRPTFRQFEQIIQDLNYDLPNPNPFDRTIDHNTTWRSDNDLGGISLNLNTKIGGGMLTSTSAWRYWDWNSSNDRDFTGLSVLSLSQSPSRHRQWSQEVRYTGDLFTGVSGVVGVFALGQDLKSAPVHTEEAGNALWRFAQNSDSPLWQTPGLFDGFGINTRSRLRSFSGALFAQLDWQFLDVFYFLPGIRLNYDKKDVKFDQQTYGGLQTEDPALLALQHSVYTDQSFLTDVEDRNISGQITLSYRPTGNFNSYVTFSTNFKPIGINLGSLPSQNGELMMELTQIKPEYVTHYEAGVKSKPQAGTTLNFSLYNTSIRDFQTQVQTPAPGVGRGYLANAERVRVQGFELDASTRIGNSFSVSTAIAYTNGKYISFVSAPVPLEETGTQVSFKDISGGQLPGISKWAGSLGSEYSIASAFFGRNGDFFIAADGFYRSSFSSSPSPSQYLNIDGYALVSARLGFRGLDGLSFFGWARNIFDTNYFEQLLPGASSAGHYAAILGDQRTFGVTFRYGF